MFFFFGLFGRGPCLHPNSKKISTRKAQTPKNKHSYRVLGHGLSAKALKQMAEAKLEKEIELNCLKEESSWIRWCKNRPI